MASKIPLLLDWVQQQLDKVSWFLCSFNLHCVCVCVCLCEYLLTALLNCATYLKFLPGSFVSHLPCKFAAWLVAYSCFFLLLSHIKDMLLSLLYAYSYATPIAFFNRALIASWKQSELYQRPDHCLHIISGSTFSEPRAILSKLNALWRNFMNNNTN